MSLGTRIFGRTAESAVERYLRRKGYRIVARNLRSAHGELDLVARSGGVLVFVEVKARRTTAFGGAPYAVHAGKQARLIKLAASYLAAHRLRNQLCRFDVLLYTEGKDGQVAIEHHEHAFEVPGDELQW